MDKQLLASLYMGKVSRDRLNYDKTYDHRWSDYEQLRKSLEAKHPDLYSEFKEFMKREKSKWRALFTEQFKTHSLFTFVSENVDVNEYYY